MVIEGKVGSEYERLNKKVEELQNDLDKKNKLLLHSSHEMRSHVHTITNILAFLHENFETIDRAALEGHIKTLFTSSAHLTKFLNELLDFTKHTSIDNLDFTQQIDLLKIAKDVIHQFHQISFDEANKTTISINTDGLDHDAFVYGDEGSMRQVVYNLINNAIKYSNNSKIEAVLKSVHYNNADYIQFDLVDEGIGVPSNELESIFELFTRSSKTRRNEKVVGSGIGLALCREIILAHQGKIWASNNTDEGATFSFIVPVHHTK